MLSSGPGTLVLYSGFLLGFLTFITWDTNPHDISMWIKVASVLLVVIIGFAFMYGQPLNWWQPFFGTDVVIDPDPTIKRNNPKGDNGYGLVQFDKEVADWLSEMGIRRFIKINHKRYRFLYKKDATRFKLGWWRV